MVEYTVTSHIAYIMLSQSSRDIVDAFMTITNAIDGIHITYARLCSALATGFCAGTAVVFERATTGSEWIQKYWNTLVTDSKVCSEQALQDLAALPPTDRESVNIFKFTANALSVSTGWKFTKLMWAMETVMPIIEKRIDLREKHV